MRSRAPCGRIRIRYGWVLLAGAWVTLAAGTCQATMIMKSPIALGARDRREVATLACADSVDETGARLDAFSEFGSREPGATLRISVDVVCAARSTLLGLPLKHATSCRNGSGRWHCEPGRDYLEVREGDEAVLLQATPGADPAIALDVLRYVLAHPWYSGEDFRLFMRGERCVVEARGSGAWRLFCGALEVSVSQLCTSAGCEYGVYEYRVYIP